MLKYQTANSLGLTCKEVCRWINHIIWMVGPHQIQRGFAVKVEDAA